MRRAVMAAAVVVLAGLVYAGADGQLGTDEPDLKSCEKALELLSRGERSGFELLREKWHGNNDNDERAMGLFDSHAGLLRSAVKSLGQPLGFELVHAEEVGQCLRRYSYVCKYEEGRIRWRFTFYRPTNEWRFNGYNFNSGDDADKALFDECSHPLALVHTNGPLAERPQATLDR